MTDEEAIQLALKPGVSSKSGPPNEGVGLTLVANLARLARGWLVIVSGRGVVSLSRDGTIVSDTLPTKGYYRGTLVGGVFRQDTTRDFARLLHQAKINAGLLRSGTIDANFQV
jgi:hypothetical protein